MKIDIKTLFDRIEYEVSYEHMGNKRTVQVIFNHGFLVSSIFAFAISLLLVLAPNEEAALVFIFVGVVCFISAMFIKKRVVTINTYDGNKIELFFGRRNKEDVVEISDVIIESANKHLLRKYSKIDPALPIEPQINNIQFLKDREIITEEEYETLKDRLLGRTSKATIGFGH